MALARRPRRVRVRKQSPAGQDVLDKLTAYLNAAEPEPVYFLTRIWNDQQRAVTYKELREAIQSGFLPEKLLQDWQHDYANFVNDKLKPIWVEAMQAANEDLAARHPEYFFDPMSQGVLTWTHQHGAEWVQMIADEQRDAIAAMLDRSVSGHFTVDELARAIRPTIGLNKVQTLANLKHYHYVKNSLMERIPGITEAEAGARAREASLKYAARQHRQRAYTIATTEMAFAYNKGADEGIKQAQEQGLVGKMVKVWSTAADELVCPICGALDGVEIGMGEDFNFGGHALYSGQKQTPPAHPRCRCAVLYVEKEPPQYEPEPEERAIKDWEPEDQAAGPGPSEPEGPAIPEGAELPPGMQYQGQVHLGGAGEMHSYVDEDGVEWLFKPAQSKGGTPQAFRAHIQEAGYKVQGIIDPDTAVPVGIGDLGGRFGAFQQRVVMVDDAVNLKQWQHSMDQLPPGAAAQLQREHVTDWLLANFDSHGGNFVMNAEGRLIGLDKEQAFRYINQAGSQSMGYSFHPNKNYGESEPIYNVLFRRFAKGEIDLDLQDTLTYIKRVEAIPDAKYREIFRGYAENLHGKGKAAETLLDQIVDRKGRLRDDYRVFYGDLLTQRTGKKQAFIWADEAAKHMGLPLPAVAFSPGALQKMKVAELKQIAKQKQIPYYNNMNKSQLVTAVSDPVKAPEMSAQVRDRLAANEAARKAAATAPKPARPKDTLLAEQAFKDLSVVPDNKLGIPVGSDKDMVEGLNLTARRMSIGGNEIYELSGKLTGDAWRRAEKKIRGLDGARLGRLDFEKADDVQRFFSSGEKVYTTAAVDRIMIRDGATTFELYVDGHEAYHGMRGYFRVRTPVTGSGAGDAAAMQNMLQRMELGGLATNPTAQAEAVLKKSRLVWQNAPARVPELAGLTPAKLPAKLDVILKQEGIDPKRIANLRMAKVFPGYQTYVEDEVLDAYKRAGLKYIWAGVGQADSVVRILKSPGLMSTNTRLRAGLHQTGMSPLSDMKTGGSDNVFTRLGVKTQTPARFGNSFAGGRYRILIDPREMQRTDWYAYNGDSFGTTNPRDMARRSSPLNFIRQMASQYYNNNEIMFRHGIARESFIGIACETKALRAELISKLKRANINEINGVPVEKFVEVRTKI